MILYALPISTYTNKNNVSTQLLLSSWVMVAFFNSAIDIWQYFKYASIKYYTAKIYRIKYNNKKSKSHSAGYHWISRLELRSPGWNLWNAFKISFSYFPNANGKYYITYNVIKTYIEVWFLFKKKKKVDAVLYVHYNIRV